MRKVLFLFVVPVLSACSTIRLGELDKNKAKWQEARISHYHYHLEFICFCSFFGDMPLVIEVQDDEVVSMEFQNGKAIRPEDRTFFESNATIDRIFASLENTLGDRPDYFSAEYHEIYGFPAQVRVDYDRSITDDEHTLIVSNFEVLP